jgi:hypothetical protein
MTADGFYPKCKQCHCKQCKDNRQVDIKAYRKKQRERNRTEKGKAIARKAYENSLSSGRRAISNKNWKAQHPEKYKAYLEIKKAIYHGTVKRQRCVVCGEKAQAHHEDYSKPLEVVWLCQKHHSNLHVEKRNA